MERRYQAVDWLLLVVSALVLALTVLNGEVRILRLRGVYGVPMEALPAPTQFLYDVVRWPMLGLACGAVIAASSKKVTVVSVQLCGVLLKVTLGLNAIWAWVWGLPCTPFGGSAWPHLLCGF